jgi:hypothetical protein
MYTQALHVEAKMKKNHLHKMHVKLLEGENEHLKTQVIEHQISRRCWRNNWYVNKANCEVCTKPLIF